jgi:hypothetical protein
MLGTSAMHGAFHATGTHLLTCLAFLCCFLPADVRSHICKPMAEACVEVFLAAQAELLPTPAHSHYVFSFRHVSRVLQVGPSCCRVPSCLQSGCMWKCCHNT